ncbi:OmpA family protein [Microbacterium aurantiacum]|uniref:OmpA family protein n=1 Tax=Microbacterium aurantiacum TaxID=162393 RepID=UPI003D716FA9
MNVLHRLVAPIIAGAVLLTGCSTGTADDSGTDGLAAPDTVVIIAGAHANMPAAQVPVELAPLLESAVRRGAPVTVIANDGTPAVSFQISGYAISTANPEATNNDVDGVTGAVVAAVSDVEADANGNDLCAALAVARDQITADGAVAASIIVIDSGLSDVGYPNLTTPGIVVAGTAETVVEVAQRNGYLPTMPHGTSVTFVGLGYGAAPQPDLTPVQRDVVKELWRTFVEAAGATVVLVDKPRTGAGPDTTYTTGIVTPGSYESLSFATTSEGAVRASVDADVLFATRSHTLSDEAQDALIELRDFLAATSGAILITGHTDATGNDTENDLLSRARADETKNWLVAHGIDAARITTEGRGSAAPVVPGATTPDELQQNRRVDVVVTP